LGADGEEPVEPESGDHSGFGPPPRPGGFGPGDTMRDLVDVLRKIADKLVIEPFFNIFTI
jgi:hypothetical protein